MSCNAIRTQCSDSSSKARPPTWMRPARRAWLVVVLCAGCYASHERPGTGNAAGSGADALPARGLGSAPTIDADRAGKQLSGRPVIERPQLPPVSCDVEPTADCVASFPRVMIVMDASSSMLGGRHPGQNNWDKARFALAGKPSLEPGDPGYVEPAFARPLEVRGNTVTMEDVFHLGMIAFNTEDTQRLMLQYTPCATDNISWAMDPWVSCKPPGCTDPYLGEPSWTYKVSDRDREPPFVETTRSYVPPCNGGGPAPCVGSTYNTFTEEGLDAALDNVVRYRDDPGAYGFDGHTRFANILITDGDTSPGSAPERALRRLLDAGVPTYVIGLEGGFGPDLEQTLEVLDGYARAGGTRLATLVPADEAAIADAFAGVITRVIDDLGTDPCCQPTSCATNPEPRADE